MSNDLALFTDGATGSLPSVEFASGLRRTSLNRDTTNRFVESLEGRELLKFASRVQKWLFGADEETLGDERIAVNPGSFLHGITCWTGGNNSTFVDEIMVPVHQEMPAEPDHWREKGETTRQYQFDLQIMEGEYQDTPLRFRSNSYGGVTAVQELAGKIADKLETEHGGFYVPVVTLHYSTYDHKTWGKLGNPIFKIVDWCNPEGQSESEHGSDAKAVEQQDKEPDSEKGKDDSGPGKPAARRRRTR